MNIQIKKKDLEYINKKLKEVFPSAKVYIFGSRVAGNASEFSDIDIAIDNGSAISLSILAEIQSIFSDSDLTFPVDITDWHRITPKFRQHILSKYEIL